MSEINCASNKINTKKSEIFSISQKVGDAF